MRIGLGIAVLLLLGAAWFVFAAPEEETEVKEVRSYTASLDVAYDEGVYEIEGVVEVDSRCETLSGDASYHNGVIVVSVDILPHEGTCLRLPTERTFSYEVEGEEDAEVEFYINDMYITL